MMESTAALMKELDEARSKEEEEEEMMMRILNGMDKETCGDAHDRNRDLEIALAGMSDALEEEEEEMRRALGVLGEDAEKEPSVTEHDIEDGRRTVAALKREAVLLKRAGQIEKARGKLREAKAAEAELERMGPAMRRRHLARSRGDEETGGDTMVALTETTSTDSKDLDLSSQMQLMLAEMSNAAVKLESEGGGLLYEGGETDEADGDVENDPELLRQFAALQEASSVDDRPGYHVHDSGQVEADAVGSAVHPPPPAAPNQQQQEEEVKMEAAASTELVRTLKVQAVAAKRAGDLDRARSLLREAKKLQADAAAAS